MAIHSTNQKNSNRTLFIGAAVVILFSFWYFYIRPSGDATAVQSETVNLPGKDLLPILAQVNAIDLEHNVAIFNDKVFNALIDFSRPLLPEPVKRPNPFALLLGEKVAPVPKK